MKIIVLAKQVPDTYTPRVLDLSNGYLDRSASDAVPDEVNERAVEVALQYKDQNADTEVTLLSMGTDETVGSLRKLLAMGPDAAVLVSDPALAGSDALATARVLAAAIEKIGADLVLAGNESTDGRGGVVPGMVAELLGQPLMPSVEDISIEADAVTGTLHTDGAALELSAPLPAVVAVTEKAADPRFPNFKHILAAKKKPLTTWSLDDLGIEAGPGAAYVRSVMVSADKKPAREAGTKITDDGTAATQLVDYLAARRVL